MTDAVQRPGTTIGWAAIGVGVVGLVVTAVVPSLRLAALALGAAALALGLVARRQPGGRNLALAGIATGGVAVLVVVVRLASGEEPGDAGEELRDRLPKAASIEDVTITGCTTGPGAVMVATGEVVNTGAEAATFSVTVRFESPDGATLYAVGQTFLADVAPGQRASLRAQSLPSAPDAPFVCTVGGVLRR